MNFDDMSKALEDAQKTQRIADMQIAKMAKFCAGRLKQARVSIMVLEQLKRELKNFNIAAGEWMQ